MTKRYDNSINVPQGTSLRKKVFDLWVANPYITPTEACRRLVAKLSQLKYFHKKHGNTIRVYLCNFRRTYDLGRPLKPLSPHRRVFVWENVPRNLLPASHPRGWKLVANRNQMLTYRHDYGTVHWYLGGMVRLHLRGPVQLSRAKELFCRAFSWLSMDQLNKFVSGTLREESKHWVFDMGSPLPSFDIRKFERSHGIRIFTDKSHPHAIEVEETTPFWIGELRETTRELDQTIQGLGVQITKHLKLIGEWQKEAHSRRKSTDAYATEKKKSKSLLRRLRLR